MVDTAGVFADQPPEGITLEMMLQWRVRFDAVLAIQIRFGIRRGDMVDAGDITQRVVLVDAPAAIQGLLGQQAVQRIPLEAVAFVVFIAQVQQAVIGVVAESYFMTERVNALLDPTAGVVVLLGAQVGRIDVVSELAARLRW
ncbi:hypothetical protein [Pseudomonas fluorescens]|uniref:hypothetical protein n=1 Tax=Pseudomonas fluorescens TaxID=294 RepID=UPI003D18CD29